MSNDATFVRSALVASEPPPSSVVGPGAWMRANLFSSIGHTILSVLGAYLAVMLAWKIIDFALVRAVYTAADGEACRVPSTGACWPYVKVYWQTFVYGRYPIAERWRVDIVFAVFAALLVPVAIPSFPGKRTFATLLLVVFPVMAFQLLLGGNLLRSLIFWAMILIAAVALVLAIRAIAAYFAKHDRSASSDFAMLGLLMVLVLGLLDTRFGLSGLALPVVETEMWGGLMVTLVVAVTGIVTSLPLGIVLALGRRSKMPIIRLLSIIYIEFWRGVPLITVLFMASTMLPLFMPSGVTVDKLLRALVGVTLFQAAYMAENIRGGLQAIPKGQNEGAMALGLGYWQMMLLIIMPQALKLVIPSIVGSFISLFKDTTLVLIVSIFDLLGMIQATRSDPVWASPTTGATGYLVAAIIYFTFCYSMSRYAQFIERRLNKGRKH